MAVSFRVPLGGRLWLQLGLVLWLGGRFGLRFGCGCVLRRVALSHDIAGLGSPGHGTSGEACVPVMRTIFLVAVGADVRGWDTGRDLGCRALDEQAVVVVEVHTVAVVVEAGESGYEVPVEKVEPAVEVDRDDDEACALARQTRPLASHSTVQQVSLCWRTCTSVVARGAPVASPPTRWMRQTNGWAFGGTCMLRPWWISAAVGPGPGGVVCGLV